MTLIVPPAEVELKRNLIDLTDNMSNKAKPLSKMVQQLEDMSSTRLRTERTIIDLSGQLPHTLNGRIGQLKVDNDIVFGNDITRGLIGLPSDIDDVKSESIQSKRKYESSQYESSQCWIMTGT